MDTPPHSRQPALVRVFAEFALLPDLLHEYRRQPDGSVGRWTSLLGRIGYNEDHVDDRHLPGGVDLTAYMAEDAMRLCERIRLVHGGLTVAGTRLANLAVTPVKERNAASYRTLTDTLALQIQQHYLGIDGLVVTQVLQSASAMVGASPHPWRRTLGGLLLVELETLLHQSFMDAARASALVSDLPRIRTRARDALLREAVPDAVNPRGGVYPEALADAVTAVHVSDPDLGRRSTLTTTELRATAMALTFAQLLVEAQYGFLIQFLRPWVPRSDGR